LAQRLAAWLGCTDFILAAPSAGPPLEVSRVEVTTGLPRWCVGGRAQALARHASSGAGLWLSVWDAVASRGLFGYRSRDSHCACVFGEGLENKLSEHCDRDD
jgi:hypothetical protein